MINEGVSLKRNIKDSVFANLFSIPEYRYELYKSIHPEDKEVKIEDLKENTIQNVMVDGMYNDISFLKNDKLIVMVEAQSRYDANLPIRMLLYCAEIYKRYLLANNIYLYTYKKINLPEVEFYCICSFDKKVDYVTFGKYCDNSIFVSVKMIYGGSTDIVSQYIDLCHIVDASRLKYNSSNQRIDYIFNECKKRGVLDNYLDARNMEVREIMDYLFSQERALEGYLKEVSEDKIKEGKKINQDIIDDLAVYVIESSLNNNMPIEEIIKILVDKCKYDFDYAKQLVLSKLNK